MRSVNLPEIVAFLKAQASVAAVFGTRIYVGEPESDAQAGIYLAVNAITQTREEVECSARVEFRYLAHATNVSKQALVNAQDAVSRVLCPGGPVTMGTFKVSHVDEGSDFLLARDDKNRNLLIRDYVFRFIWSN